MTQQRKAARQRSIRGGGQREQCGVDDGVLQLGERTVSVPSLGMSELYETDVVRHSSLPTHVPLKIIGPLRLAGEGNCGPAKGIIVPNI